MDCTLSDFFEKVNNKKMKTILELIAAALGLATAILTLKSKNILPSKNKVMTEKLFVIIALLVVCAIIVFGICYVFKTK
jgi:hypothetical protein